MVISPLDGMRTLEGFFCERSCIHDHHVASSILNATLPAHMDERYLISRCSSRVHATKPQSVGDRAVHFASAVEYIERAFVDRKSVDSLQLAKKLGMISRVAPIWTGGSSPTSPTSVVFPSPVAAQQLIVNFQRNMIRCRSMLNISICSWLVVVIAHAFRDGNGRLARLTMYWVLREHGINKLNALFAVSVICREMAQAVEINELIKNNRDSDYIF